MCTDNAILLANTRNERTIMCVQRSASKIIPTEDDIIAANKLAFNDDIGVVTNHVTSMFEVQAGFEKDSPEYKELEYRIMCGQLYQQATIDRAKGVVANSMPQYWYKSDNDDELVADKKPYFMIYVYPDLKTDYNNFVKSAETKARLLFGHSIDTLRQIDNLTDAEKSHIEWYDRLLPVGKNPCIVNRIAKIIENEFDDYLRKTQKNVAFDSSILKSGTKYTKQKYKAIAEIKEHFARSIGQIRQNALRKRKNATEEKNIMIESYRSQCYQICPNENELCDILVDLCYQDEKSKAFLWVMCADVIFNNLIERNHKIIFPVLSYDDGDFKYMGFDFEMLELYIG